MRLIDADALKKNMEFTCMGVMAGTEPYSSPLKEIDDAPTIDALQVVRCKDCKHSQYDELFNMRWCNGKEVKDDDFCSYGERKEDETD